MPAFPGVDFLDFDSLLNDEELLARKTARQFVDGGETLAEATGHVARIAAQLVDRLVAFALPAGVEPRAADSAADGQHCAHANAHAAAGAERPRLIRLVRSKL